MAAHFRFPGLATDPIADQIIGYCLVKINDQAHLRRFLLTLDY